MNQNQSLKELEVLLKYMIAHNKSHNEELKELAEGLKNTENEESYNEVMAAIEDFNKGNAKLSNALEKFKK